MKNKIKLFVNLPFKIRNNHLDGIIGNIDSHLFIGGGIGLLWSSYEFDLCDMDNYYPKGEKVGKHIFTLTIGLFNWAIRFIVYRKKLI